MLRAAIDDEALGAWAETIPGPEAPPRRPRDLSRTGDFERAGTADMRESKTLECQRGPARVRPVARGGPRC